MAITDVYKLHAVEIDTDAIPGTPSRHIIGALDSGGFTTDMEIQRDLTAGSIYAQAGRRKLRNVGGTYITRDLETMLDLVGIAGSCIESDTRTGVIIYYARYDCSQIAASGHLSYTVPKGLIVPQTLNANHDVDATLSYRILGIQDGANSPLIKDEDVTLPTLTDVLTGNRWGMYTASINGTVATHKKSIGIDFGAAVTTDGSDNDDYHSWATVDSVLPVVTIGGIDPGWMSDEVPGAAGLGIGLSGADVTHANTIINLKKNGVVIGTAEHITITAAGPAYFSTPVQGDARQMATSELRIEPIFDGTNAPLVISTGVVIT